MDLTNRVFGKLTVKRKTDMRISNRIVWECECECGNIAYVTTSHLTSGKTTSCGCARNGVNAIDITNKVFGRLTAKEPTNRRMGNSIIWRCECECGNIAYIAAASLTNGSTTSCGCYSSEVRSDIGKKVIAVVNEKNLIDGTNVSKLGGKLIKSNTSGVTGVSYDKSVNLWKAKITFKKKIYRLGGYHDIIDAIAIRRKAEEQLHGEFLKWYAENYTMHMR